MKRFALALALCALALPALADGLTISTQTSGLSLSTPPFTAAQIAELLTWAKATYGPNVCDTATPPVCHVMTNTEAFNAIATGMFRGLRDNVAGYEAAQAKAALTPPTPIPSP